MIYGVAPIEGRVEWKVKTSAKSSPASLGILPGKKLAVSVFGDGFKVLDGINGKQLWADDALWNGATSAVFDGNRVLFISARNQLLVYRINN